MIHDENKVHAFYFVDAVQSFSLFLPKPFQLNPTIENAAFEVTKKVITCLHSSSWCNDKKLACWSLKNIFPLYAKYKSVRDVDDDTILKVLDISPAYGLYRFNFGVIINN